MEFLIITLAIFGGFFKGIPRKVSSLNLPTSNSISSNISASLLSVESRIPCLDEPRRANPESRNLKDKEISDFGFRISDFKIPPTKISDATEPDISAKSAILLDMETDKIIFAKSSSEKLPIASISKIFTALVAEEKLSSDKIITITQEAVDTEALAGDLKAGEEFRAGDLIDLMLISSSNDAAIQLAEKISGGESGFADLMNKKAAEFGLKKTSFVEPSGLSDQNISTAFEIAQIADATFGKSSIWNILGQKEADIYSLSGAKHYLKNTNEIIADNYIIAGKTGYTNKAKGTLVVIADSGQNNRKIISVVLGSEDRFGDTRALLKWARGNFKW